MLGQYGHALLVECEENLALSQELVSDWLSRYMFKDEESGEEQAKAVAAALADHKLFKSHARHISRDQAKSLGGKGLFIDNLEDDHKLQDAVLSVFHATMHTYNGTGAIKIIENHMGPAYVKVLQTIVLQPGLPEPKSPLRQPLDRSQ